MRRDTRTAFYLSAFALAYFGSHAAIWILT